MFYEEIMYEQFKNQDEDPIKRFKEDNNIKDDDYLVYTNLWIKKGVDIGLSNGLPKKYALSMGGMFAFVFAKATVNSDTPYLAEDLIARTIMDEYLRLETEERSLSMIERARKLFIFIVNLYLTDIRSYETLPNIRWDDL